MRSYCDQFSERQNTVFRVNCVGDRSPSSSHDKENTLSYLDMLLCLPSHTACRRACPPLADAALCLCLLPSGRCPARAGHR